MKKLLAVLLAVLMLISACAMAEGGFGGKLVVKDVVIDMGGQVIDLSGVGLTLALASDGTQGGLRMAVDAAGANVLNAILASDAEQMTLRADGISDVYAVRYEDLLNMLMETEGGAEFMDAFISGFEAGYQAGLSVGTDMAQGEVPAEISALMEHAVEIISSAITIGDPETIEGVEYEVLNIAISEEQAGVLLNDLAAIADVYAKGQLAGSGYDSYGQLFDDAQLRLSVDGTVYMAEANTIASINVNAFAEDETESETLNIYADVTKDAENGAMDVYVALSEVDSEETEEIVTLSGTYTEIDGEFASFEMTINTPDDADNGVYAALYAPSVQGNGLWQFSIGSLDDAASFHVALGTADGTNQFSAQVLSGEQSVYLDYIGADGVGNLSFGMVEDGERVGDVSAIIEVAADDGAWLPGTADETVNMLTVGEEQMQKLSMEGMSLLMNALSGLSQANESLAAMIGSMMG